jgi:glycosyltransferase involved in cell wall biosynthesis
MPVVALATTEVVEAVPADAGVLSTRPERLHAAVREYLSEPDAARLAGKAARAAVLERYGLDRFLGDWDRLLEEVTR